MSNIIHRRASRELGCYQNLSFSSLAASGMKEDESENFSSEQSLATETSTQEAL
jgi:hypothetical protein